MKIYQIVTALGYGDAVGNNIIALMDALRQEGYETGVYAETIDVRIGNINIGLIQDMPLMKKEDIIIYHLATGAELNYSIVKYSCRKILVYHNITPPHFFLPYNEQVARNCEYGLEGTKFLVNKVDYCLADSAYNKKDLESMGSQTDIDVLPILVKFEDYNKTPDVALMKWLDDGFINLLFVGRIAPNKKQEDVIAAYAYYKKHYNPNSRLILAGSYDGMENYYLKLKAYIGANEIDDVIFTGHIRFSEVLAYYRSAHVFLCMSEHEGFCVPLVEAMFFQVPIIAYASTAVPETLDRAGVLMKEKNPLLAAGLINRICLDKEMKKKLIECQRERLNDFLADTIKREFINDIKRFIGE
ncbi:glycosyltransferase [Clostridium sp. E02]|uniref:glycosyltransferase family 4 protein n=1 Tax=Clostridium sp. E02 TaxID=2487134 RepID=UPI000F53BE81|nr:glycosyltransferase [Clostridium sp. E02]